MSCTAHSGPQMPDAADSLDSLIAVHIQADAENSDSDSGDGSDNSVPHKGPLHKTREDLNLRHEQRKSDDGEGSSMVGTSFNNRVGSQRQCLSAEEQRLLPWYWDSANNKTGSSLQDKWRFGALPGNSATCKVGTHGHGLLSSL